MKEEYIKEIQKMSEELNGLAKEFSHRDEEILLSRMMFLTFYIQSIIFSWKAILKKQEKTSKFN